MRKKPETIHTYLYYRYVGVGRNCRQENKVLYLFRSYVLSIRPFFNSRAPVCVIISMQASPNGKTALNSRRPNKLEPFEDGVKINIWSTMIAFMRKSVWSVIFHCPEDNCEAKKLETYQDFIKNHQIYKAPLLPVLILR